jgi:hypothetical protein
MISPCEAKQVIIPGFYGFSETCSGAEQKGDAPAYETGTLLPLVEKNNTYVRRAGTSTAAAVAICSRREWNDDVQSQICLSAVPTIVPDDGATTFASALPLRATKCGTLFMSEIWHTIGT